MQVKSQSLIFYRKEVQQAEGVAKLFDEENICTYGDV
jgi:hypothetical protein